PSTKIKFSIPLNKGGGFSRGLSEVITLKIYNLLGQEITTLINEQLLPGSYEVTWDGTNYPSGVYYYKLAYGDISFTKKMVLIK
ncbi:MAG: T9SS type A sorting domain-containing protein, partial [Bacteroidales bacterium]